MYNIGMTTYVKVSIDFNMINSYIHASKTDTKNN